MKKPQIFGKQFPLHLELDKWVIWYLFKALLTPICGLLVNVLVTFKHFK